METHLNVRLRIVLVAKLGILVRSGEKLQVKFGNKIKHKKILVDICNMYITNQLFIK